MTDTPNYRVPLDELEDQARVPRDEQVEEQPTDEPGEYVAAEDLDRARLLGITGAGRLHVR